MEETEIPSIYSNSRATVVTPQERAVNALPFRAGVLTQRTGHFAQVIKHGSSQGSITGVVQKAAHVGSCTCWEGNRNLHVHSEISLVKAFIRCSD